MPPNTTPPQYAISSVRYCANPDAINLYASAFGVRRVVLPRVLTVEEIAAINREIDVETEVFVFGGLRHGRRTLFAVLLCNRPPMNDVRFRPSCRRR